MHCVFVALDRTSAESLSVCRLRRDDVGSVVVPIRAREPVNDVSYSPTALNKGLRVRQRTVKGRVT